MHKFTNKNPQIQIEAMASNASLQGAELTAAKDLILKDMEVIQ